MTPTHVWPELLLQVPRGKAPPQSVPPRQLLAYPGRLAVAATPSAVYSFAQWSSPLSTQVVAWGTQTELSSVSSAPQPLAWLSLAGPGPSLGQRCVPSALLCGARGFLYLCICTNVYSDQSILNSCRRPGARLGSWGQPALAGRAGAGRGATAKLKAPPAQLGWLRVVTPLSLQHCAVHPRPLSKTRACPRCPGLRLLLSGAQSCPFSVLFRDGSGASVSPRPVPKCPEIGLAVRPVSPLPRPAQIGLPLPSSSQGLVPDPGPCPGDTSFRNA
ncbi:hypothetical protein H8959_021505 [Pygathrix nigripes]